ncbi:hypothetical protein JCM10213_000368 [Rhodosporidiobolus nylandii]
MNPLSASGPNRLPVSPRRQSQSLPARHSTFQQPFPVPSYLRHSALYADRFYTTPSEESPYSALGTPALKKKASLSDALSAGSRTAGAEVGREAPILLPTCWDEDDRCALLELSSDGLGVSFAGSAKYGDRDAAAIRANRPVPSEAGVFYFEVTIKDKGVSGYIGIGLSHRTVSLSRLPGWEENSYGFHADDGRAFCCQGTGEPFGPTFTTGDVIGCGVDFTGAGPPRGERERSGVKGREAQKQNATGGRVFFTKNGEFLGYAFCNLQGKLYPTVGLRTPRECVRVNFGADPFRFDIEGLVLERKRTVLSRIASTAPSPSSLLSIAPSPPIPSLLPPAPSERLHETIQTLISSYLFHHGYAATASAFSQQIREQREERAKGLLPPTSTSAPASSTSAAAAAADHDLHASIASSSATRSQIRAAAISGQAQLTLTLLQQHYPSALEPDSAAEDGDVLFKLRCRVFVEAALALSKANQDPSASFLSSSSGAEGSKDVPMSDDPPHEETFSTPLSSPTFSAAPLTLDDLLTLGRSLHNEYAADPRPRVREELQAVLGVMAYSDPEREASGRTREVLSAREREKVADEVNRAVLLAASLPPVPGLEQLYRHTAASIQLAGDLGAGSAAMVDVRKEVLGGL